MLGQSTNVSRDAAFNPNLFEGAPEHRYLTRWNMRDDDEAPEAYEWAEPDLGGPLKRLPAPDDLTAARLARLPLRDDVEWEVALAAGGGVLQPTRFDRPELLLTLFVVDRDSGYVLVADALPASIALEDAPKRLADVMPAPA